MGSQGKTGPRRSAAGGPRATGAAPARITKPERLLNLVAFLLSSRTAVPFSLIKGRVAGYDDDASPEALEKRFDRDKAELRALGVPIVYEAMDEHGHDGYRIPREQYFLPEVHLNLEEAAALAVVHRYAMSSPEDPLAAPLRSALRKVVVDSPLSGAAASSVTEQHRLGVRTRKGPPELAANLEVLTDAVVRRQAVKFRYYSVRRGEVGEREIEAYGMGWHGSTWYVVGFDRHREAVRQFKVDRVRGRVKLRAGKPFAVPDDFDVASYVGRPAFQFGGSGAEERVDIELRPEVAFMFSSGLREGWTLRELPSGGALLSVDSDDRHAVLRFVARQLDRARVVSPPDLVEEARAKYSAILDRHTGTPSEAPGDKRRSTRRKGGSR